MTVNYSSFYLLDWSALYTITISNYYKILEITKDASDEEVKKAYKKMAKKCHPDKNRDNQEDATSKFKQISEAYQVLSDAETRRMYDKNVEEKNLYSNNYGFSSEEDNIDNFFNDNSDKNTYKNFGFDTSKTELDELLEYLDSTNHNYSTENYFFEDRKVKTKEQNNGIFEDNLNIFNSLNTEFGMMNIQMK